jgi:hypothetical protein
MKLIAVKREGLCLSERYVNAGTKLIWQCKSGHIFKVTPAHVKNGQWCRKCGAKRAGISKRLSMDEIRKIARSRNGKCLSDSYNPKEKLKWQCDKSHIWEASVHSVKARSWCPVCSRIRSRRKPLTIEEMREIASFRGGLCLSPEYQNTDIKLEWQCKNGHVWWALPSSVKKGHWCAECAGVKRLDLDQAREVARERVGQCLSIQYNRSNEKLKWQCTEGHTWSATFANIKWGRWCPECSSGMGERICRAYFEQMFSCKFPKARPTWLINSEGFQMELDGYCKDIALAFEHQGLQHFEQRKQFQTAEQFNKRKKDDMRKILLCKRNNITLIEIPQIPDMLSLTQIQQFIVKQCLKKGYRIPADVGRIPIDLRAAYSPSARKRLQDIRDIASTFGGTCLSFAYLGVAVHLRFRCAKGHEWETIPNVIFKGHWCPKCADSARGKARRLTLQEMQEVAASRKGSCLSKEYVNANSNLLWECSKGHQWSAIPNSIKRGSWCAVCSRSHRRAKSRQ